MTYDTAGSPYSCGNNVLDEGEQCDDGNMVSNDGCSSTCENELPTFGIQLNDMIECAGDFYGKVFTDDISKVTTEVRMSGSATYTFNPILASDGSYTIPIDYSTFIDGQYDVMYSLIHEDGPIDSGSFTTTITDECDVCGDGTIDD